MYEASDGSQLDPTAVTLARAIRKVESGGDYNRMGASGERGAYQWMPGNYEKAAQSAGIDPRDFSPVAQDKVAYHTIKGYLDQGYSQSQIASLWNSGSPDSTGKVGVNKYGVKYDVPGYQAKVKDAYLNYAGQPAGATKPQPGGPDINTNGGETPVDTSTYQYSGRGGDAPQGGLAKIGHDVVRGLVSPTLTLAERPIQLAGDLTKIAGNVFHGKHWSDYTPTTIENPEILGGKNESPRAFGEGGFTDVAKDVGRGVETVALGLPIKGLGSAARTGALQGFGASIEQQGDKALTTVPGAVNTALNTGIGAAGGALTYGAMKGIGKTVEGAGNLMSGTAAKQAREGMRDAYAGALNLNQSERAFEQRSGRDLADVLMKNQAPLSRYEDGTLNTSGAVEKLQKILDPLNDQADEMLNNPQGVVRPVDLEEVLGAVQKRIQDSNIPASEAKAMVKAAKNSIADEVEKYGTQIEPNVSDLVKRAFQKSVFTKAITPEGKLVNNVNYIISDELNNATEKALQGTDTDLSYRALNAERSELVDAIKRLAMKDGVKLVRGGRLGNMMGGIVGGMAGSHAGPLGVILGDYFGTEATKFLNDPATRIGAAGAKASVLNRLPVNEPLGNAVSKAGGLVKRSAPLGARGGYAAVNSLVGR